MDERKPETKCIVKKNLYRKKAMPNIRSKVLLIPVEKYLEPSRTSMMEHFC